METFEALMTRRSIRKYEDRPVPPELVEEILRAAMAAPTAGNGQPWEFVVITDRKLMAELAEIHENGSMIKDAPLGILVCGNLDRDVYQGFWVQDCSAAIENLLLAAHALGLGAVWTAVYPLGDRPAVFAQKLHLPEQVVPLALIPIGWPGETLPPEDRYDPAKVHRNVW